MSEDTIDYKKLAEALAEALEQRNLWIEGEEYRELVILRMRLSARVDSLAEELKAANARIAELDEQVAALQKYADGAMNENDDLEFRIAELEAEVTKGHELQDSYCDRIAELEGKNNRLAQLLYEETSQLQIATDLGNKRWIALNDIYKNCENHNVNWCKRRAAEGFK